MKFPDLHSGDGSQRVAVRRVVTGHTDEGLSTIEVDEEIDVSGMHPLWELGSPAPDPSPTRRQVGFEPDPGGVTWLVVQIPPEAVTRAAFAAGVPGHDDEGWHQTDTVDLVVVLSGPLVLGVETGEVELATGDCVVQQGTRHAWFNRTETNACLMTVSDGVGR